MEACTPCTRGCVRCLEMWSAAIQSSPSVKLACKPWKLPGEISKSLKHTHSQTMKTSAAQRTQHTYSFLRTQVLNKHQSPKSNSNFHNIGWWLLAFTSPGGAMSSSFSQCRSGQIHLVNHCKGGEVKIVWKANQLNQNRMRSQTIQLLGCFEKKSLSILLFYKYLPGTCTPTLTHRYLQISLLSDRQQGKSQTNHWYIGIESESQKLTVEKNDSTCSVLTKILV